MIRPIVKDILFLQRKAEKASRKDASDGRDLLDTLTAQHQAQCLLAGDTLLGYFVAMPGHEEVHLLNITVAPEYQRQGWAHLMLDALALWAHGQRADWVWLEVRVSNVRAQQVYLQRGFVRVGMRKRYYPAEHGEREDAVVMSLRLEPA